MLLHRHLSLFSYLESKKSFFVFGVRRVGKSSLIEELKISFLPWQDGIPEIVTFRSYRIFAFKACSSMSDKNSGRFKKIKTATA
jgi:predicted AAA+ superfamily ATPase